MNFIQKFGILTCPDVSNSKAVQLLSSCRNWQDSCGASACERMFSRWEASGVLHAERSWLSEQVGWRIWTTTPPSVRSGAICQTAATVLSCQQTTLCCCCYCRLTRCDPPSSSSMRSMASHRSDRVVRIRSTALSCQLSSRSWMALIVVARSSSSEPPTGAYFCG